MAAMRLFYLLACVSGKVVFPAECNMGGSGALCSGPSCPPCWLDSRSGGYDCYAYLAGTKTCPFNAEDVSGQLTNQPPKPVTSKGPTPTKSYTSTSTVIVYVTVTVDSAAPRLTWSPLLLTPLLFVLPCLQ